MELSPKVIRLLIKEEISKSLLKEESQSPEDIAVTQIVSRLVALKADGADADGVLASVQQQYAAAKNATQDRAANRKDINEMGCGDMQSIDMGVDKTHDDDHEGSMAKRQMFKTAQYAADIFDMIEEGEEFPAWVQSKMTKIADYIGAVKHYLEYDHVMGEELTKKQIKGRDDDAKSIMKSTKEQYGKEEGERAAYAIATNIQKEKAKKK